MLDHLCRAVRRSVHLSKHGSSENLSETSSSKPGYVTTDIGVALVRIKAMLIGRLTGQRHGHVGSVVPRTPRSVGQQATSTTTHNVERSRQTDVDHGNDEQRTDGTKDDVQNGSVDEEVDTVRAQCRACYSRYLLPTATISRSFHLDSPNTD